MKRSLALLLALLMVALMLPLSAVTAGAEIVMPIDWFIPLPDPLTGDLDGDGFVTDDDAIYLLMYTFFPEDYPVSQSVDYDHSGDVTDDDAIWLLMFTFFPEDYPLTGDVAYETVTYTVADNTDKFSVNGRTMTVTASVSKKQGVAYDHAGQAFCFTANCEGDVSAQIEMMTSNTAGKEDLSFLVRVDGVGTKVTLVGNGSWKACTLPIATGLSRGKHTFEIYRCNEAASGLVTLMSVTVKGTVATYQAPYRDLKMVFLGDSITAGNGVLGTKGAADQADNKYKDATLTYAFLCGEMLNADFYVAARSGAYTATDTTSNCIYYTYDYVSKRRNTTLYDNAKETDVDVYVISLGTNDVGTGNGFSDEQITANIKALLARVRADHPNATIVWTYGQLTLNRVSVIRAAVQAVMATDANLYYYQYKQTNTQGSNSHPNVEANARDAQELADFIKNTVLK